MYNLLVFISAIFAKAETEKPSISNLKAPEGGFTQEQYLYEKIQRMVDEFDSMKGALLKGQYKPVNKEESKKE